MLSHSRLDYSTMRLESDLSAVAFSVSIRADRVKLGGFVEEGPVAIANSCEQFPDGHPSACRDEDKINLVNIKSQKYHYFSLNTRTLIFSYGDVNNMQSTQGVCSKSN